MLTKTKHQSGFNLIEIIIATTVLSGLAFTALSSMNQVTHFQNQAALKSNAFNIKANLFFFLNNEGAWENTIKAKSLNCIIEGNCRRPVLFDVKDSLGNSFYNSSLKKAGFTLEGNACNNYPSDACPIKVNVEARVLCATCSPKQTEISVSFQHFQQKFQIGNHNFTLIKNLPVPTLVDCANTFNLYGHPSGPDIVVELGMPPRGPGVIVSRDVPTQEAICSALGCGPPTQADAGRFKSCGNNGLIRWDGTAFVRVGGCFGGGWHMSNMRCSPP